jgi:hypothetical protein
MFYAEQSSGKLRFGDVVSGYVTAVPNQEKPIVESFVGYEVRVKLDPHLVVLTPCCSIKEKTMCVVPLIEAKRRSLFFENENYRKDMTLLNHPLLPREWRELGEQEVTSESEEEQMYVHDSLFIYLENIQLPKYKVKTKNKENKVEEFEAGYYYIDFRNISNVKCSCIAHEKEGKPKPKYDELLMQMLSSKKLELSIDTRSDLRNKLAYYFLRVPEEDRREQG